MLADAIDELLAERNPFDGHAELQELVWTDVSIVLVRAMAKMDVMKLNKQAWAADGVIPFDRCVAIQLAVEEAEAHELEMDRLMMRSVTAPTVYSDMPMSKKLLYPRIAQNAQKSLSNALAAFDQVDELVSKFSELCDAGFFQRAEERAYVQEFVNSRTMTAANVRSWCSTNSRIPRASDLWDCEGGVCGDEAMALMRRGAAARETRAMVAAERPARQAGRFRGPRNANFDEYLAAGAQVMDKLMTSDTSRHDLEWLSFDDLKKIYVFMTEAWFNSQWTRGALLAAVTSIASEKHPELLGGDSPRSERPPGSPANSLRSLMDVVSELDDADEELAPREADLSMHDRSLEDEFMLQ